MRFMFIKLKIIVRFLLSKYRMRSFGFIDAIMRLENQKIKRSYL